MRCFISIEIPENIKEKIIGIQEQLPEFKGKLTEFENLHLTLKFLGEVNSEKIEEVRKRLREIKFKEFYTQLDKIGFFDNEDRGVIWLHATNCDDLQKEIDYKLEGLFEKEKRFMSHLTIARVKSVRDKKKFLENLKKIKTPKMKFIINSFNLKKSILMEKGPIYEDIEVYKLN